MLLHPMRQFETQEPVEDILMHVQNWEDSSFSSYPHNLLHLKIDDICVEKQTDISI